MAIALLGLDWTMELTYMACAAAGGTVLVLQTALLLFGVGEGGDGGDLHARRRRAPRRSPGQRLRPALGARPGLVLHLLRADRVARHEPRLGIRRTPCSPRSPRARPDGARGLADAHAVEAAVAGQPRPRNALGQSARVYLRIPGHNSGFGKVTVKVQGRTAEFNACTPGSELPTGALVKIARMSTPDTFEVEPLPGQSSAEPKEEQR